MRDELTKDRRTETDEQGQGRTRRGDKEEVKERDRWGCRDEVEERDRAGNRGREGGVIIYQVFGCA